MEFMDLPSKALYPDYYKMIKHPRAFNTVFVRSSLVLLFWFAVHWLNFWMRAAFFRPS